MRIVYLHEFIAELDALDSGVRRQIRKKLDELARADARGYPHQPLKGAQFKGLYKFRVGDWRLIYQLRGEELCFVTLGHRGEVYR